ncbi:MAG: membrane protein insertase YidC [Candidatus Harrisonbacteria bacterium]|nr:membrane protein insertase YidC [Candidatus Harrisonbacteria bacterium]
MFNQLLTQPIFNALVVLNNLLGDFGFAIILITILIRLILYPLFYKSMKNQVLITKIQPMIKEIQEKHKDDRQVQTEKIMALYKEYKINPFSGFLIILIQIPIFIAIYNVFLAGVTPATLDQNLYSFISRPEIIITNFLSILNLSERSYALTLITAAAQYFLGMVSLPKDTGTKEGAQARNIAKKMMVIGPILTLLILGTLPSAVGLYWLTSTLFSLVQQVYITRIIYGQDQGLLSESIPTSGV